MTDGLKDKHRKAIIDILSANERVERMILFGSRAMGTFTPTSDVDIVLYGTELTPIDRSKLAAAIDELTMPQQVDLLLHKSIKKRELLEHIEKHGVEWWRRSRAMGGDWQPSNLGDVIAVNPSRPLAKGSDSVYISMQQVETANRSVNEIDHRAFKGSGARFRNGDTLLARITPCLENGKTAYVDFLDDGEVGHGSTEFIVLSGIQGISDDLFVYYLARYPEFRDFAMVRMEGSSGRQRVPASTLRKYTFACPSYDEQRAIAHILGSLDDKIELNRRMNQTLEATAHAIFKSWFVDFDPVRARRGEPLCSPNHSLPDDIAALFPESFEDSELGEIPTGWKKTTLGDEIDLLTGFPFKSKYFTESPPGIRLARGMNVKEGSFYWESQTRYWPNITSDIENYLLKSGDVLIGMDGSKVGKNWVRVRPNNLPCLLVQRVARLREKESIGENFIWIMVGGERFRSYIDAVKTGTSIPHISGTQIKSYGFIRPPAGDNRLFDQFEAIVTPFTQKADANIAESEALSQIRDTLLPKLISGELRVPDAEKFVKEAGV